MEHAGRRISSIEGRLPAGVRLRRVRRAAARTAERRALLSGEERARLDGYGVEKRRREFLLGRVAARKLLADVLRCAPHAVPLTVAESGAVEVGGGGGLRLSISHAGEQAVAVIARCAVGVDLEAVQPRPERLHRFLLAEAERPLLEQRALPVDDAFTLCWALKEAVLKALHCGLRRSPKAVRIAALDVLGGTARLDAPEWDMAFEARFARDGGRQWLAVAHAAARAEAP